MISADLNQPAEKVSLDFCASYSFAEDWPEKGNLITMKFQIIFRELPESKWSLIKKSVKTFLLFTSGEFQDRIEPT